MTALLFGKNGPSTRSVNRSCKQLSTEPPSDSHHYVAAVVAYLKALHEQLGEKGPILVEIAMDETAISSQIDLDSHSGNLIGFCGCKIDSMEPCRRLSVKIPTKDGIRAALDNSVGLRRATDLHLVMIVPLDSRLPPFPLTAVPTCRYTSEEATSRRLNESLALLQRFNEDGFIKVVGWSSDGDSSRRRLQLQQLTMFGRSEDWRFLHPTMGLQQDPLHVLKKLVRALLHGVSMNGTELNVEELQLAIARAQHEDFKSGIVRGHAATLTDVASRGDTQDVTRVFRLCSRKTIECLGTETSSLRWMRLYLEAVNALAAAYLNPRLGVHERISSAAFAYFFVLIGWTHSKENGTLSRFIGPQARWDALICASYLPHILSECTASFPSRHINLLRSGTEMCEVAFSRMSPSSQRHRVLNMRQISEQLRYWICIVNSQQQSQSYHGSRQEHADREWCRVNDVKLERAVAARLSSESASIAWKQGWRKATDAMTRLGIDATTLSPSSATRAILKHEQFHGCVIRFLQSEEQLHEPQEALVTDEDDHDSNVHMDDITTTDDESSHCEHPYLDVDTLDDILKLARSETPVDRFVHGSQQAQLSAIRMMNRASPETKIRTADRLDRCHSATSEDTVTVGSYWVNSNNSVPETVQVLSISIEGKLVTKCSDKVCATALVAVLEGDSINRLVHTGRTKRLPLNQLLQQLITPLDFVVSDEQIALSFHTVESFESGEATSQQTVDAEDVQTTKSGRTVRRRRIHEEIDEPKPRRQRR
jgi:hypothetical protein